MPPASSGDGALVEACPLASPPLDPWWLTFTDERTEQAYQQSHALWAAQCYDVPAAAMVCAMCLTGALFTWAHGMSDCLWGISGASAAFSSVQLAVVMWAVRRVGAPNWRLRPWLIGALKLFEAALSLAWISSCRTFWDETLRRFIQALLDGSGVVHLALSALSKPLPFHQAARLQALACLAYLARAPRVWCRRYLAPRAPSRPFHGRLVAQLLGRLMPPVLGVGAEPLLEGGRLLPSPDCACPAAVALVVLTLGLLLPLCISHATDFHMRRRWFSLQPQPQRAAGGAHARCAALAWAWPWGLEVSCLLAAHLAAWSLLVAWASAACPAAA